MNGKKGKRVTRRKPLACPPKNCSSGVKPFLRARISSSKIRNGWDTRSSTIRPLVLCLTRTGAKGTIRLSTTAGTIVLESMRRKIKTTPFQREILWALADDGRASVLALLKDLALKFPAESPSTILQKAERDIRVLEGLFWLFWQNGSEERAVLTTERSTMPFKDLFRWNETSNQWEVQPREPAFTDIILQLTQGGVEALDLIAAESSEPTPVWRPKENF